MSRTRRRVLETILNLLKDTKYEHESSWGSPADLQHAAAPHSLPTLFTFMHTILGFIINIPYFWKTQIKGAVLKLVYLKNKNSYANVTSTFSSHCHLLFILSTINIKRDSYSTQEKKKKERKNSSPDWSMSPCKSHSSQFYFKNKIFLTEHLKWSLRVHYHGVFTQS